MAARDRGVSGEQVEVALGVGAPDMAALAARDDARHGRVIVRAKAVLPVYVLHSNRISSAGLSSRGTDELALALGVPHMTALAARDDARHGRVIVRVEAVLPVYVLHGNRISSAGPELGAAIEVALAVRVPNMATLTACDNARHECVTVHSGAFLSVYSADAYAKSIVVKKKNNQSSTVCS